MNLHGLKYQFIWMILVTKVQHLGFQRKKLPFFCCWQYHLVCWSPRVAPGFLATSSLPGLISSTTRGGMTAMMTWRGASCLRTSKPGRINKHRLTKKHSTRWEHGFEWSVCPSSLAADSYEWGSQSSGISAYIGDDSYHLPLPPEELSHYWWSSRWLLPTCGVVCFCLFVYVCTVSFSERGTEGGASPSTRYVSFLFCLEKKN